MDLQGGSQRRSSRSLRPLTEIGSRLLLRFRTLLDSKSTCRYHLELGRKQQDHRVYDWLRVLDMGINK